MENSKISVTFQNEASYFLGDEIAVEVTLLNENDFAIPVTMPVVCSGKLKSNIFTVLDHNSDIVEYQGLMVKSVYSPIQLKANENIGFTVFMGREYNINKAGNYSFYSNYLQDSMGENSSPYSSFTILDRNTPPILTWSSLFFSERPTTKELHKSFGKHQVYKATEEQFSNLKEAHKGAVDILHYINVHYKESNNLPDIFKNEYEEVICKSGYYASKTLKKYIDMEKYMESGIKYHFQSSECGPGIYGYVYPSDSEKNIYLCNQYDLSPTLPASEKKYDTKAGVIIHEVSHKSVKSQDHFYGYNSCKIESKLCKENVEPTTVTNADCLQIFSELAFLSGQSTHPKDEL